MLDGLKQRAKNRFHKMKVRHKQEQHSQKSYIIQQKQKNTNKALTAIHSIFHFNRHGVLRRYAMIFGLVIFGMMVTSGIGFHKNTLYKIHKAETLTSYKSSVSFSQTSGTQLNLRHVQIASNHRTAYVPFHFSNMDDIPSHAGKYSIYVGGALQKMKRNSMTGQMILFGPTARGVILLHCVHRIPNKPIYVILRSNEKLSSSAANSSSSSPRNARGIGVFEGEYNALDFKINPDAGNIKVNPKLKTSDSISKIYSVLFGHTDAETIYNIDRKSRRAIKIDENKSQEYLDRLKNFGFKMPVFKGNQGWKAKKNHVPAFMNPKWRPYDYVMSNGIPHNKKGKINPKNVREDAAYSPINDTPDDIDDVHFPQVLKKPDGTTTDDSNNNEVQSGGSNDGGSNSDDSGSNSINGGSVDDPSKIWQDLQDTWQDVLTRKQNIYAINAGVLFKIKATVEDMNTMASKGSQKHFEQVN